MIVYSEKKSINSGSKESDVSELLAVPASGLHATVWDLVDGWTGRLEVHQGLAVRGVVNLGGGGWWRWMSWTYLHHPRS